MVTSLQSVSSSVFQTRVADARSQPQVANAGLAQRGAPDAGGSGGVERVSISSAATIQLGQDRAISAGKLINQADRTLAKQQETLSHMNANLQVIVKQFPPYGQQDPQRTAFLMAFSGLRKEIEALQVPRDPQAEQGLPDGVGLPSQGQGLNLPNLDATASDKQVAEAAQSIQTMIVQVAGQRADLARSVQSALGGGYSSLAQQFA
ncbi:MAG: hypothetical protein COZ79_08845 [Hydrogenophilales bacterium CG_4_8_14_3_um_filter_62_83]|nr:MAG: hypothetical protein COZ79_08845 [Hydrogenophilales bacterium CG_4_8_14_3_um_filter_62_83]